MQEIFFPAMRILKKTCKRKIDRMLSADRARIVAIPFVDKNGWMIALTGIIQDKEFEPQRAPRNAARAEYTMPALFNQEFSWTAPLL